MPSAVPLLQAIPPGLIVLAVVFAAAAAWVLADARARFSSWTDGWVWAAGTLVALPIFLPLYLIGARPVGRTIVCPSCGRGTLSHRAACLHCGHPITFEAFPETWGLGEVIGVATVFMVSLPLIAGTIGVQEPPTPVELGVYTLAQNVLLVGLAAYVATGRYHQPLSTLGIRVARWPWLIAIGILVGSVTIPLSAASERLAVLLIGMVVGPHRAEAMSSAEHATNVFARVLQARQLDLGELVSVLVLVGMLAPIGEEVFFRGFVYGTLRRWGVPLAVALSAAYFGAVHQQIVHFLPITILGVILALLYQRTASLVPSMAVHAVNNIVAILSMIYGWDI